MIDGKAQFDRFMRERN